MWEYDYSTLCHHGILGQKWGVRRFQNPDGTLTPAGKKRYLSYNSKNGLGVAEKKNGFYDVFSKGKKVGKIIVDDEGDTSHIDYMKVKKSKNKDDDYEKEALDMIIKNSMDKGKKYITSEVLSTDEKTLKMYEKAGFKYDKNVNKSELDELGFVYMKKDLNKK